MSSATAGGSDRRLQCTGFHNLCEASERPAVSCSDGLDGWGGII
jgi:hypothetical protein